MRFERDSYQHFLEHSVVACLDASEGDETGIPLNDTLGVRVTRLSS